MASSFIDYLTTNAPAGVCLKTKATATGDVEIYILNAPAELIEWPEIASNARRFVPFYPDRATAEGLAIYEELRAIAATWSKANGGASLGGLVFIGSPSRGFVPVAKDTPRPRASKAWDADTPPFRYPRELSARDRDIVAALHEECRSVARSLRMDEGATAPADLLELSERIGKDIHTTTDARRVVEVKGFRIECDPAATFVAFHRYARTFGVRYHAAAICRLITSAPVPDFVAVEHIEGAPAPRIEPADVPAEIAPVPVAASVEVEPAPAPVEVNRAPRASFRKAFARLIVAALSLTIAALRVLIACARLIERGRLFEVIASTVKGRAVRLRSITARRAFVVRGRAARRVAAVRSAVAGRVVAVRVAIVGRYRAICAAIARRVAACRTFVADCLFAARLRVLRRYRAMRSGVAAFTRFVGGCFGAVASAPQRLANAAAFVLIITARRAAAVAEILEHL